MCVKCSVPWLAPSECYKSRPSCSPAEAVCTGCVCARVCVGGGGPGGSSVSLKMSVCRGARSLCEVLCVAEVTCVCKNESGGMDLV